MELPAQASVADALAAAARDLAGAGIDTSDVSAAIFGRSVEARALLRNGDRLELLRPLLVTPQAARAGRAAAARRALRK